jgi:hypothetical protein
MLKQGRRILINWRNHNCGVHQYGLQVASGINAVHCPVSSLGDVDAAISYHNPQHVIWNWHAATLGQIVNPFSQRHHFRQKHICLLHEFDQRLFAGNFFDAYVMPDPTNTYRADRFHTCERLLPEYANPHPEPDVATVGSFGFAASDIKGYETILDTVRSAYPFAIVRLHIPSNWFGDPSGARARSIVAHLQESAGRNYIIQGHHDWLDEHDLLNWLGSNTINIFPYAPVPHPGISSSTDWAIASKRPVAVSRCGLFKHLHHLPICLEDYSVREIADRGVSPIKHLWEKWSKAVFSQRWDEILLAA